MILVGRSEFRQVAPRHGVMADSGGIAPCVKLVIQVNVSFTPQPS
jgi:hypothetical protein